MKHLSRFFLGLLLAGGTWSARAQSVGVGTPTPSPKAALEIASPANNSGLLIPRLTAAQRAAITSPPQGLMVYQTDGTADGGTQTGFWYYAGSPAAWVFLNTSGVSYDPAAGLQVGTAAVGSAGPFAVGTRSAAAGRPFAGSVSGGKQALIYTAAELTAAGVRAGPITGVGFLVETKASARPYTGFTVQLGTTALTFFGGTFPTGLTTVFSADYTTFAGLNVLPCNAGSFVWDGTSSLLVSTCFGGTVATADDQVATFAVGPSTEISTSGPTVSCATTNGIRTNVRPVLYLRQDGGSYVLPAAAGTAGQVLTQQASGAVAFQNPQWTQSGSALSPSVVGTKVGIGTTTPLAALDVARGAGPDGTAALRGTARTSYFNYGNAENTYIRGGQATADVLLNDTGGQVGIGTATPAAGELLDVAGTTRTTEVHTPTTGTSNMLAAAYGQFGTVGNTYTSSGNMTIATVGPGLGHCRISFTAASGLNGINFNTRPVVVALYGAAPGSVGFTGNTGTIDVYTFDNAGTPATRDFTLVVYAP